MNSIELQAKREFPELDFAASNEEYAEQQGKQFGFVTGAAYMYKRIYKWLEKNLKDYQDCPSKYLKSDYYPETDSYDFYLDPSFWDDFKKAMCD